MTLKQLVCVLTHVTYTIKDKPEDFRVDEVLGHDLQEEGSHLILSVTKRRYNTEDMIDVLADHTRYDRHRFNHAGNKDRQAITTQYVSVKHASPDAFTELDLDDITINIAGWADDQLNFGDHAGNAFTIYVKRINEDDVRHRSTFINYFDEQRFSTQNHLIGKHLVNGAYEAAAKRLQDDDYHGRVINDHLDDHANDYITALRQLPDNLLSLFVHAYQSQLWNRCVQRCHEELDESASFPLIGFGTRPATELEKHQINQVKAEEDLTERSFIIRSIPELSAEGTRRDVYKTIDDLAVTNEEDGVTLSFYLDKGSYATMAVKHLVGDVDPIT